MNISDFSNLVVRRTLVEGPEELIQRLVESSSPLEGTDSAVVKLVKDASPSDRSALIALIRWAVQDALSETLSILDPASGAEHCGDLLVIDKESQTEFTFLYSEFSSECERLGFM